MWTRSERERALWRAVAVVAGAIYLSAPFVLRFVDALRQRNLLRLTIWTGFVVLGAMAAIWIARARGGWRAWGALVLAALAYVAAALRLDVIQERVHLVASGIVALLLRAALQERATADPTFGFRSTLAASCGAFALAFLFGVGDEALQGLVPSRHADLRDLGLNAGAAAMALAAAAGVEHALARDRRAGPALPVPQPRNTRNPA